MSEPTLRGAPLDRVIRFLTYLTPAVVPLVYYNNPIATEYFFSKAFFFNLLVYGTITLYFARAALRRELRFHWGYTFLPLVIFSLVALQSLIGATNVWKGWETFARVGACIPFLFLLYQVADDQDDVRRFLLVAAITNILVTLYGFLQFYEVFPLPRDQYGTADPSTTIGLTNFVMEYLTPFQFVMPLMVLAARRRYTRLLFLTAALFQYYYFLISDNRAAQVGWLAGAAVLAVLFIMQYRRGAFRLRRSVVGAIAAAAVVVLVAVGASPQGARFVERARSILFVQGQDDAITFRLETWKQSLQIIRDYPVRGVGLSNLEVMFPLYQSAFLENMTLKKNTRVVRAHNEYVQVVADLGILGALAFAFFLWRLVKLMRLAYRRAKPWNEFLLVSGLVAGVAGYLVVAFFAFPFEVPSSALSIFFVIGLLEVMTRKVLANDDAHHDFTSRQAAAIGLTAAALTALYWAYATNWMYHVLRAEVYFKESRVMKELNQWDTAKALLDDAVRFYPQNEAYYYDRSIFAIRAGDTQAALDDLSVTSRLVPNYAMGRKQIGLLAAQMGDYRRAATEFEHAFRIYRYSPGEFLPLLLNSYMGSGQIDKAVALADRWKDLPGAEAQVSIGQVYMQTRSYPEAVTHFEKALAIRPEYAEAYTFLGMVLLEQKQYEPALANFDKALALDSKGRNMRSTLLVARAKTLISLGRLAEARGAVADALASDPGTRRLFMEDPLFTQTPQVRDALKP